MTKTETCHCEHADHFEPSPEHAYGTVPAGASRMLYVGRVCDDCANGHSVDFIVEG